MKLHPTHLLLMSGVALAITTTSDAQTVLFDMGRKDGGSISANGTITGNGALVSSPATPPGGSGSFYWNSFGLSTESQAGGSFSGFTDINNNALAWTIGNLQSNVVAAGNGGLKANGFNNGGLIQGSNGGGQNPTFALLNNLAVANATGDYWFVQGASANGSFTLGGLDNSKLYNFTFFGSRVIAGAERVTRYFATGASGTLQSIQLKTTGTGIGAGGYNGNNDTTVSILNVAPVGGNVTLTFQEVAGGFAYLNAMQVDVVPEPSTNALLILTALAGSWLSLRRKTKVGV